MRPAPEGNSAGRWKEESPGSDGVGLGRRRLVCFERHGPIAFGVVGTDGVQAHGCLLYTSDAADEGVEG